MQEENVEELKPKRELMKKYEWIKCWYCNGEGFIEIPILGLEWPCYKCWGKGEIRVRKDGA